MSEADRALHQRIAAEVKRKLEAKGQSIDKLEVFERFYEFIAEEADKLRREYQVQLREGIRITIDLVNTVQQDKQDGDIDIRVEIAPNANIREFNIPSNKVDGVYLSNAEKKVLERYIKAGHSSLSDEEVVRKFRSISLLIGEGAFRARLQKAEINDDISILERVISLAQSDLSKVDEILGYTSGSYSKLMNIFNDIQHFTKTPIASTKPSYFSNPSRFFQDVNMNHILGKHSISHFDFAPQHLGTTVHMFPLGTTQAQIESYIDEALSTLANASGKGEDYPLVTNNTGEQVTLSGGITVLINSRMAEQVPIIGQFYPLSGAVEYDQKTLRLFKKLL